MHVLNGYKDVRKLATTEGTISDQLCCRDLHRMWQKSSDPWMKNSHMKNSLNKSCVHFWVSPALQQPLMNFPVYASNLAKISLSTSTSTGTSTGGAPRSYHVKKHTSSHSASSALHCKTQQAENCEKLWDDRDNCKLLNLQKCFDEATRAYKQYRVTEHRRELEVFETSMEINETTHHPKSN